MGKHLKACPRSNPWPGAASGEHIDASARPDHGIHPKERPADAAAGARAAARRPIAGQLSGEQPQQALPRLPGEAAGQA